MMNKRVKNIILDLGGVLLDVDYNAPVRAFSELGLTNFEEIFSKKTQVPFLDAFEKGLLSEEEFREEIRIRSKLAVSDAELDRAWNSILGDIPEHRMRLLHELKKRFPLFLLSNTNEIHIRSFEESLDRKYGKDTFVNSFSNYYYSSRIGMRKPDPEIFLYVIEENDLNPKETLFIDDSPQHIEGALKAGLQALHLKNGVELEDLLADYGIKP